MKTLYAFWIIPEDRITPQPTRRKSGGAEVCVVEHGSLDKATVEDDINWIAKVTGKDPEAIKKNFVADKVDHARGVGVHEEGHCESQPGGNLADEADSDKRRYAAVSMTTALEQKDARAIFAMFDLKHATNPVVMGDHPAGQENFVGMLHVGAARIFDDLARDYMEVDRKTPVSDWDINKYSVAIQNMKEDLINSANAMPEGSEKTKALMVAEAVINYAEDFEDAYRRRVNGENIPERKQLQLVSVAEKAKFYEKSFNFNDFSEGNKEKLISEIKGNIQKYEPSRQAVAEVKSMDFSAQNGAELVGNAKAAKSVADSGIVVDPALLPKPQDSQPIPAPQVAATQTLSSISPPRV